MLVLRGGSRHAAKFYVFCCLVYRILVNVTSWNGIKIGFDNRKTVILCGLIFTGCSDEIFMLETFSPAQNSSLFFLIEYFTSGQQPCKFLCLNRRLF